MALNSIFSSELNFVFTEMESLADHGKLFKRGYVHRNYQHDVIFCLSTDIMLRCTVLQETKSMWMSGQRE